MDLIESKANAPVLSTSGDIMKAVYWTNDLGSGDEVSGDVYPEGSYSYVMGDGKTDTKQSKWANAMTEDGSYWVWIPRYAYKITYTNSSKTDLSTTKSKYGNIDVLFMYGTSDTHYRDKNGKPQPLPEGYKVHPAFQAMTTVADLETNPLGKWDEELEGIWVAKYEASMETSTGKPVSKPSVSSWSSRQNNIYQNCLNMYKNLNSHEMKNSEWGAVAYLTHSAYGRNGKEIGVNQCSSYYTGGGPGGTANVTGSQYSYSSSTFKTTYAWNTEQGKKASTTGNIYGVYDMSGGAYEYVAAYVNNGSRTITGTSNGGKLGRATELKTKQIYNSASSSGTSNQTTDYNLNKEIYGDAVYETSTSASDLNSWHSDYSNFPYSSDSFFRRGGIYNESSGAGMFSFKVTHGNESNTGFRPVLCVSRSN